MGLFDESGRLPGRISCLRLRAFLQRLHSGAGDHRTWFLKDFSRMHGVSQTMRCNIYMMDATESLRTMALSRPLHLSPTYIGLTRSSEFIAITLAPLIGGAVTSKLNWRWCFYILPMAACPADIALFLMRLLEQPTRIRTSLREQIEELDIFGIVFSS